MLSVIELAQLLTGALDEKFNITKKEAAVQVVACLEAFNITQESFREVQNTRLIKDLQALRQNKANDSALAKRIKNILRKWKERLAAPTNHSSQPNSPQNMSQGSSDTQFMTQQSQSPPISQLPNNHQRSVNGPTSFSNLLPKQQQQQPPPMNHHLMPITKPLSSSPVAIPPHQNGTTLSQESSSLLGKRKLDTPTVVVGDVDENSNHSRNKKMKKFNSSAIPSPLSLNPNNSSINHNNHQINPPIPAVPAQQNPPEEIPKKRGRKKGSKGIDSMLNGIVPDFQAEIQQKIALSAGKRNKTTVELQQMFESHQNTAMSWTNGDIDSSSLDRGFSSLSSFHPPDASHASHGDEFQMKIKQEIHEESRTTLDGLPSSSSARSLCIEDEIAKLRAQLPPIDFEAAENDVFEDYATVDEYGENVECTCTFREVTTYAGEDETTPAVAESLTAPTQIDVKNGESEKRVDSDDDDDDDETDDFCAVDDDDDEEKLPPPTRGAVKSIFDPEYDANENVIEEMVLRKPRENASKVIEVKIDKRAVKPMRIEPLQMQPEPIQQLERVPIINYVCEEDPMCPARAHFQREPVTDDNVRRLHKGSVNGVNGFWNGILEEKPVHDYKQDTENIDYAKHQLWKRVVPRYDFLTCDKIPKTFDDSRLSLPPPPPSKDEHEKPFNGLDNKSDIEFREWHEVMNVRSYNDDVLTILPYVIID